MDLFGDGNFLRSAEMEYVSFMIQEHLAHDCIETLGELGVAQFTDLNGELTSFKRHYTPIIRKAEEMEKKLKFFEDEMSRNGISPERYTTEEVTAWMGNQKETLARETRGTSLLDFWDAVVSERHKDYLAIKTERDRTAASLYAAVQRRHVIEKAAEFFNLESNSPWSEAAALGGAPAPGDLESSRGGEEGDNMSFKHLVGILATEDKAKFMRIVFRASSGHAVVRFSDIASPLVDEAGATHAKSVFAVFFRGRTLGVKLDRICTAFSAHTHDIPNFGHESEVAAALEETRGVIGDSIAWLEQERATSTSTLRHLSLLLRKWRGGLLREKAIAHTLNCCTRSQERGTIAAQAWVLKTEVGAVRDTLQRVHTEAAEGGRLQPFFFEVQPAGAVASKPPTYIPTNRITSVFQGIVNTYGIPRYQEINPALYYIATFPFLFGVMYGDIGHGTLLTLFAAYLVYKEAEFLKNPQGEIFSMAFKGRYMLLMMGCYSIYCGLVYNDLFAIGVNLFGTKYTYYSNINGTIATEATFTGTSDTDIYPFGADPAWHASTNELLFFNSLKMKMSVVLGITQMMLGLVLKLLNTIYFKSSVDFWFEAIPQLVFMTALFGYMVFLIFFKWSVDWRAPNAGVAPSLIDVMINLVLKPGTVLNQMYAGQSGFQSFLLLVVFFTVPLMLFVKPILLNRANKKAKAALGSENEAAGLLSNGITSNGAHANGAGTGAIEDVGKTPQPGKAAANGVSHDDALVGSAAGANGHHAAAAEGGASHEHEHGFGDLFIHSAIETIEFVLGSVSNTASYLRLWALSLAHSQLATVFWERALVATIEMDNAIFVVVGYAVWWALTFGVLMGMDVLECFLHALRLHWVELDNKFFKADGYKFTPISWRALEQ